MLPPESPRHSAGRRGEPRTPISLASGHVARERIYGLGPR
jgi:hypothetical protein